MKLRTGEKILYGFGLVSTAAGVGLGLHSFTEELQTASSSTPSISFNLDRGSANSPDSSPDRHRKKDVIAAEGLDLGFVTVPHHLENDIALGALAAAGTAIVVSMHFHDVQDGRQDRMTHQDENGSL